MSANMFNNNNSNINKPFSFTPNPTPNPNPNLFGNQVKPQTESKDQGSKGPLIIMNTDVEQKQSKPFVAQRNSLPTTTVSSNMFQNNSNLATNGSKPINDLRTNNDERIKKLQQKNKILEDNFKKLQHQFDTYRTSNPSKNDFLHLLKQIESLKLKVNSFQKREQIQGIDKSLSSELKQSIETLKKINLQKQTDINRAVFLIQKQNMMLQKQSSQIENLSNSFQRRFMGSNINSEKSNFSQQSFLNQKQIVPNHQMMLTGMFQKKQYNPLSQSAVFGYENSFEGKAPQKVEYVEGNYLVQYVRSLNGSISELKISNLNGKVQILEGIKQSEFKSKPIEQLVRIQQNSSQIIDPILENRKVRLTTYNFMNCRMLSFSQKLNLRKQVEEEVKKCGLYLEDLDLNNGNLCLLTKK